MRSASAACLLAALLASGCAGAPARPSAADYLPLRVGATWTYRITRAGGGAPGAGRARVEARDYVGPGPAAFRVRWELLDETVVSWERPTRDGVVCDEQEIMDRSGGVTAEEMYEPRALVLDERPEHLVPGASWSESFLDTSPNDRGRPKTRRTRVRWTTEAVDDAVTVPAGTFHCVRVRRDRKHEPATVAWYAAGVGLVKEVGAGLAGDETLALTRLEDAR